MHGFLKDYSKCDGSREYYGEVHQSSPQSCKASKHSSIIGFRRGDAIKNDITAPNGTPASSNPRVTGMVEHTQKGVRAPKIAPIK